LSRAEIPDIVFATGGPWTSLLVGRRLAESWGVPFIADYRDPWTSNPYVSFASAWLNAKARELEESVGRAASRVITNTHELRLQLKKDYPGLAQKVLTITNGFDPDSFDSIARQERPNEGRDTSTTRPSLKLCHFGTVYGKRTPAVLLQTLLNLCESGRLSSSQLSLRFVGSWEVNEAECEEPAQRLEKLGLLKREPPVPYQACLQQMAEADALLVIQPNAPLQIPGKIYEYVATRRPLLLIGGEGATASLVQRHRLGLACPNDADQIRRLIVDLVERRQSLPAPAPEEVDRFNYRSLTGDLAKVLDEVYQARQRKSA
jgi:glycosyltransferase involved in cell wall biosynthesis